MERKLSQIVWENGDKRDRIVFTIETTLDDGNVVRQKAVATEGSPEWEEAFSQVTEEDLDNHWAEHVKNREERKAKREEEEKSNIERMKQEALFEVKLEIFEIDAVKASKNRKLKAAIRKAKTQTEALCYAAACVSEELRQQNEEEKEDKE